MDGERMRNQNHGKLVTPRSSALEVLCRWEKEPGPIGPELDMAGEGLGDRDRQLLRNMVLGILSNMELLDLVASGFSKHPLKKMKPWSLMALRLGVYQLLFLDRIPESAAVNETVKAFRSRRQPVWLVRYLNGVLREVCRKKESLPKPGEKMIAGQPILNHSQWHVHRWTNRYGREGALELCWANNRKPTLTLCVNVLLISRDLLMSRLAELGVESSKGFFSDRAILLNDYSGLVQDLPGYDQGWFHVQDEAAQLAVGLLGPLRDGLRYLDGCAGLGGKTVTMGLGMEKGAELSAVEPEKRRFGLLEQNLARMGLAERVDCFAGTLDDYAKQVTGKFSAILVDAPCSGTGVIRRHPDMRWTKNDRDLLEKQRIQKKLLQTAVSLLEKGGVLVYATCSLEPEENDQVVEEFLMENPGFRVIDAKIFLPEAAHKLVDAKGYFRCSPLDGLDGFFGVRLEAAS